MKRDPKYIMHHSERCDIFLKTLWHTSVVMSQWWSTS